MKFIKRYKKLLYFGVAVSSAFMAASIFWLKQHQYQNHAAPKIVWLLFLDVLVFGFSFFPLMYLAWISRVRVKPARIALTFLFWMIVLVTSFVYFNIVWLFLI
jgi:hypothetical protein